MCVEEYTVTKSLLHNIRNCYPVITQSLEEKNVKQNRPLTTVIAKKSKRNNCKQEALTHSQHHLRSLKETSKLVGATIETLASPTRCGDIDPIEMRE